ncbi:vitellogenin-5-like [Panonychus citri]|uniref:vitellogenin-5-like n=1 Tax=Panonychus citri TaxID=50023 RepID=UPI0023078CB7|nr:vitellogenin-5-like [Panonychus citri]
MKIALFVLGLFVVSAFAGEIQPQPIRFKVDQIYKYDYSGHVLTGLPESGSSLYSGHQLNSTVELSIIKSSRSGDNGKTIIKMELTNIVLGHLLEEVNAVEKATFIKDDLKQKVRDVLALPVQFTFNEDTESFEWIEVQKSDAPWSVNIKKSIIDLLQLNIVGKNARRSANDVDQSGLLKDMQLSNGLTSFGVHESTIKGECETNYQIVQAADPTKVRDALPGADKFHFTVIKTRNFDNCVYEPSFASHNWDRNGCVEYCKRFAASTHIKMDDLNKHLPIPDETETSCSCDPKETQPVDQYSTIRYNVTLDSESPIISEALGKGKIIVDNHGTKFVVYTQHSIVFVSEQIQRNIPLIPEESVIRVNELTFTLFPYKGMDAQVYPSHVIPVYNILVPKSSENLVGPTVDLLNQVAKTVMEGASNEAQSKAAWYMVQVVQNLAHLSARDIKQIYDDEARIEDKERFTNTEHSVVRQLLLDALAHVGTKATAEWFQMVLAEKSLSAYEERRFVETIPRNTYAPSRTLLAIMKEQISKAVENKDYDKLSAFAVTYGKLISKACQFEVNTESNEIDESLETRYVKANQKVSSRNLGSDSQIDYPEAEEKCTKQDADQYIRELVNQLQQVEDVKGKVALAQALAHSGQYLALKELTPYITGAIKNTECIQYVNGSSASDCIFLRSSIIYSLHHMVPVSPKLLRSIVLPVFQNKYESYELRLAAFTVFMAAGPKPHELHAVAEVTRDETNRQVISMVRSVLEETANLTQACHLPLAAAAREIIPTLPVYNFDGVYSRASYNEWYSEEKSTGFFLNGQYVANNMSFIPRHGYLSLGSHWKSLTNSWLTIAYQQKGLEPLLLAKIEQIFSPEWFMATLSKSGKVQGEKPIDEIFKTLGITERAEEEAKVKLFFKLFEQTSLFTLDKHTIEAAYKQFNHVVRNFVGQVNARTEYNWVRFTMPSGYVHVVPSDLGLPIVVSKQRPNIVALRLEEATIKPDTPTLKSVSVEATLVPQLYYTSSMSVSAFQQGIKKNFGAYSLKKFNVHVPVKVSFNFEAATRVLTYSVEPTLDTKVLHTSNTNRAFLAGNYIGLPANESPITKKVLIESHVPAFKTNPRLPSRELGMDIELSFRTERPWFLNVEKIPTKGFPTWILEKYAEMNEFNFDAALTLRANKQNPSAGVAGSFDYNFAFAGDYKELKHSENHHMVHERSMLKKLGRQETRSLRITKEEIRKIAEEMVYNYPGVLLNRKTPTLTRAINWSFRTLSQEDGTHYNATLYLIQSLDYQTYWVKYVSTLERPEGSYYGLPRVFQIEANIARPALPTELKWEVPQLNKFIGKYIANLTWGESFETLAHEDRTIFINGFLHRTVDDQVVGEQMKAKSWYHEQCSKDIKQKTFMSYACQLVAHEQSYFNKVTGTVEFKSNLNEKLVNSTNLFYQVAKLHLNSYWRPWSTIASYAEKNVDGKITFELKHSNAFNGRPVVNFDIRTPHETSIWYKLFYPIQRFAGFHPIFFQKASVLPKDQTCGLMVNHIRTFDNVTFEKPSTKCEYLLSMDCSPARRFAVTVQEIEPKNRLVKVIVGKQVILVKSIDKYQAIIEINGEQKTVKPGQSHILNRQLEILAVRIFVQNAYLVVELPQEHVRVVTDGQLVKVVTSPLYMGKTCGLCGNQDQEAHMELQGPQNCIYEVIEDFQNSYSLGECHNTPPTVPPTCNLVPTVTSRKNNPEQYKNQRRVYNSDTIFSNNNMRLERETLESKIGHLDFDTRNGDFYLPIRKTLIVKQNGENCFSKYVVPTCLNGEDAEATHEITVPLVCFPQMHPVFHQWVVDSEERVIDEVAQYQSTSTWSYKAPIVCYRRDSSIRGI